MSESSFGFNQPEDSPGFLLWQTTVLWQRAIKTALEPYDVSHAQFVILAILLWCEQTQQKPIQSFLSNTSKLDKMTVSQAIKKLAASGLVKRDEHEHDTRAKSVGLTGKGKLLTKKLVAIIEKTDQDFFNRLNTKDQKNLTGLLTIINQK